MNDEKDTKVKNMTDEELIQDYINRLSSEDDKVQKALVTTTTATINKGKLLNELKPVVERNGLVWQEILEKELPFISPKDDQRCRRLALNIDLTKYPNLAYLPVDTLNKIIQKITGIKSLETIFDDGCVDLRIELTSPELIHAFKKDVQTMLSKDSGNAKSEQIQLIELINKSRNSLIKKLKSYTNKNKKSDLKNNKPSEALKNLIDDLNTFYTKITGDQIEDKTEFLAEAA